MRTPHAALPTSAAYVHQPWQVSEDDDYNRWRGRHIGEMQLQDAWSIKFFQDRSLQCPKYDDEVTVAHLRVATIFMAAHLTTISIKRMKDDSCCNYHIKTSFEPGTYVSAPERTQQIHKGP